MCKYNKDKKFIILENHEYWSDELGDYLIMSYVCSDGEIYEENGQGVVDYVGKCENCPYISENI